MIYKQLKHNSANLCLRVTSYPQATLIVTLIATLPMNREIKSSNEGMRVKVVINFY